jgi:hypothetical protein
MNAILKYHLRQLFNYWHHLRFRIRIEIIILFVIFYTFFTDKLVSYFNQILEQPHVSPIGLTTIVLHFLLVIIIVSTPFIYFNLFPKQKGLSNLSLYPLNRSEATTLQLIYFVKYQLLIILIALPVISAVTISTGPLSLLYILIFSCSSLFISSVLILVLVSLYQNRLRVLAQYFLYFFIYFVFFTLLYLRSNLYVHLIIFIICGAGLLVLRSWNRNWQTWDQILNRYRPAEKKSTQMLSKLTYFNFPATLSKSLKPVFVKELLSHLRNKNYLRLKILSIALYLTMLILIDFFYFDYYPSAISVLTILLIWEHYSHQFNEKYVLKESLFFIKVLPITYFQYSMSKFLSEFLYIIFILFIILILTLLHSIEWIKILNILGIVTLFSIFVLYIITIIRVIFYDNPRMAGYAYHFLIIFTLVMIFNFYLVGPIITLLIILYIQFISYRQFTK